MIWRGTQWVLVTTRDSQTWRQLAYRQAIVDSSPSFKAKGIQTMKLTIMGAALALWGTLWLAAMMISGDTSAEELQKLQSSSASDNGTVPTLAPVESIRSGLLLEPPIDLSEFSHKTFVKYSADVGANKIGKAWTTAVTALPPHKRAGAVGLTEDEVKEYMLHVSNLFDRGEAVPVSDVGLISSQEDVVRQPMFNHIAAFSNESVSVYLLAQSYIGHKGWSRFSILQDRTAKPPVDFYAEIKGQDIQFEGASCCKCHSSGALAIHPGSPHLNSAGNPLDSEV